MAIGKKEIPSLRDTKGDLCIYASVLLYLLLLETKCVTKNNLKFLQGYYHHEFMEQHIFHNTYKHGAFGLHSYIELNDYVIDTTIHQIDFIFYPGAHREFHFIGETTEGTNLYGYEEGYKTVYKYAKKIAKSNKLTVEEWLQHHKEKMNDYVLDQINKIQNK
ncbi:hypothetical protein M3215_22020 [Bacillus cytotoxicus]|uniref:Uncharacterized protein n=1 Tax=Bacillus cytotoxicus TaxID=580165 RepID=A0ACC6ABT6_9BACI|nr:hypothetical protein [Bacillus cytotoxicus]